MVGNEQQQYKQQQQQQPQYNKPWLAFVCSFSQLKERLDLDFHVRRGFPGVRICEKI